MPTDPAWAGGDIYVDDRSRAVDAPPDALWAVIEGIGGTAGWYSWGLAWRVRGWLDKLFGGPGLRRGRRSPYDLQIGDAVDWWRVEEIVDRELLRLRAEMRVPGQAWLDLGIETGPEGQTVFRQRAVYAPKGAARPGSTGGRSGRSTGSCSAGCNATSRSRPRILPPGERAAMEPVGSVRLVTGR